MNTMNNNKKKNIFFIVKWSKLILVLIYENADKMSVKICKKLHPNEINDIKMDKKTSEYNKLNTHTYKQ